MEQAINWIFTIWSQTENLMTLLLFVFTGIGIVAEIAANFFAPGIAASKFVTMFRFIYHITILIARVNTFLQRSTFTRGGLTQGIDREAFSKYLEEISRFKKPINKDTDKQKES